MCSIKPVRRALSLIELLVALSILAILFSILLPAMAGARIEGLKTKCLTRLRGIAQTASAYSTEDPRGVYGPVHQRGPDFHAEGYADYGGGPGLINIPNLGQVYMWEHEFDPATRPFNQMIYGVEGVAAPSLDGNAGDTTRFQEFRCPGEDFGYQEWPGWPPPGGLPDEVERPYFWTNGTSYRMNNLTYQESAELFWIGGVYSRAVSQIPDSSITIGFMEARAFQTIHTNDAWGELEVHGELSGYHKKLGYFNVSYADGHAAYADMGNGTFYQRKLSNLFYDVRGTWGRMDCLPDKMILDD